MTDRILFGVIALLLTGTGAIGVRESINHPAETIALVPRAADVVTEAASDTAQALHQIATAISPAASEPSQPQVLERPSKGEREREVDDEDDEDDNRASGLPSSAVAVPPTATTAKAPTAQPTKAGTFTMQQVAAHNSSASCYTAVNGSVYDLTSFIGQHPGGQATIKSLCGIDGTAAFAAQHGAKQRPISELASHKIGVLVP